MRVAVGALCKLLLRHFGIEIASQVLQIGKARVEDGQDLTAAEIKKKTKGSEVNCVSKKTEEAIMKDGKVADIEDGAKPQEGNGEGETAAKPRLD